MGIAARLGVYACALGLALGLGWGVGRLAGPDVVTPAKADGGRAEPHARTESGEAAPAYDVADGLAAAAAGYRLAVATPTFQPGTTGEAAVAIPHGLACFTITHAAASNALTA